MRKILAASLALCLILPLGLYMNASAEEEILYVGEKSVITKTPIESEYRMLAVRGELVLVRDDDYKFGLIDKSGTIVLPIEYDLIVDFNEGLAAIQKGEKYGFIDKFGKIIIPLQYDYAYIFSEGLAAVKKDGKWGFIDENNVTVLPFDYDFAQPFSEGLAAVSKSEANPLSGRSMSRYGFIDKTGALVIPHKYSSAFNFSEGLAAVRTNAYLWGFVDKTGELVIPAEYSYTREFSEGFAAVWDGKGLGYIDKTGKLAIPYENEKYDRTGMEYAYFSDGLARVYCKGKDGYIDKTGAIVIPIEYDWAEPFENGVAFVYKEGKNYYIDKNGTVVVALDDGYLKKYITEVITTTVTPTTPVETMPPHPAAPSDDTIRVIINGQQVAFADQPPVIVDGRTLVPVRGVFETLGFEVDWDSDTSTAILTSNDYELSMTIDRNVFTTNGQEFTLDIPAQLIGGRTMVPLRLPLESVGYNLYWDAATQTVIITG